jgi:hypothetical protein
MLGLQKTTDGAENTERSCEDVNTSKSGGLLKAEKPFEAIPVHVDVVDESTR